MRNLLTATAVAALLASGAAYPASAQQGGYRGGPPQPAPQAVQGPQMGPGGIPAGSYQQSCRNEQVSGRSMTAECRASNGRWAFSRLPYAAGVDHLGGAASVWGQAGVVTNINDAVATHGDGAGVGFGRIYGVDLGVTDDQVGLLAQASVSRERECGKKGQGLDGLDPCDDVHAYSIYRDSPT